MAAGEWRCRACPELAEGGAGVRGRSGVVLSKLGLGRRGRSVDGSLQVGPCRARLHLVVRMASHMITLNIQNSE